MSLLVAAPRSNFHGPVPTLDSIAEKVKVVLARAVAPVHRPERRKEERHPFPHPIRLTPLTGDGRPEIDQTIVGIGKHLSLHGIDFYSAEPLPFRRTIVTLDFADGGQTGLLLDLKWCRFTGQNWYENGGRFVELAQSPFAEKTSTVNRSAKP